MVYDYEYFKKQVLALTKIDLNCYKEKQMKRRIDTLISRHNLDGYDAFLGKLKTDATLLEEFVNYLTINVSEFYRNPDQWVLLDKDIIPELIGKFGKNLKIWSAACSTGDEPYSLVMALSFSVEMGSLLSSPLLHPVNQQLTINNVIIIKFLFFIIPTLIF